MAKKDKGGNLITAPLPLKKLYLDTYRERLSHRPMKANYKDIYQLKTKLWNLRYEELKSIKSQPWTLTELSKAIKGLKVNQSGDPSGIISELFKPGVLGKDLEQGLLMLCNTMKSELFIPALVQLANITTIFKNKGSRLDLANDRGIFILSIFRKITDKLIYQDKYDKIDSYMSDSNIGARRKKNIRNHLFVIYAILNSVVNGKSECIDIQIYDLVQAFDSLWLEDCLNDVYDALDEETQDDKVALLYDVNKQNRVAVNTAVGQTDRIEVEKIVTQGGTWGSLLCSNHIDSLGRRCKSTGQHMYNYKNKVEVLPLAMVDDLLGVASCGLNSLALNIFINTQIELKKLKFHTTDLNGKSKCHVMHVGKKSAVCPKLEVHGTTMNTISNKKYLGDILSDDGKNDLNIKNRAAKGMGNVTKVMNILEKVTLGRHYFQTAMLLRESVFLSALLTNAECWHGLTTSQINQLETVDKLLLRKILKTPSTTPVVSLYLELGILRIGTIIKARRINFLHYLLRRKETEMIYQIFSAQWSQPTKNDWTSMVKQDLIDFNIETNLSNLKMKSEWSFKNLVKKKAHEYEFNELMIKKQKYSKLNNLKYTKLEMQRYLKLENLNTIGAQTLFKYRVRMANYGENFRGRSTSILCPQCNTHLDSQKMCFENCQVLKKHITISGNYNQIFNPSVPNDVVQTLMKMDKFREESYNNLSQNEANSTSKQTSLLGASGNYINYQNS